MRKNNRYSLIIRNKKRGSVYSWPDNVEPTKGIGEVKIRSYTEPVVSFKYKPMVHILETDIGDEGGDNNISVTHTYGNNLSTFANEYITVVAGARVNEKQTYDELVNLYSPEGSIPSDFNPEYSRTSCLCKVP